MRKNVLLLVLCLILLPKIAKSDIGFGFTFGLATPNNQINDVYNTSTINSDNIAKNLFREGTKSGYDIGFKLRVPLSNDIMFIGGVGLNRFPETSITVTVPGNDTLSAKLNTTENIIPISVGMNAYIMKKIINIYLTGELTYNYISSSIDYSTSTFASLPLSTSASDSRVGCGVGAGFDLDIELCLLNFEAKYNVANFIGQTGSEKTKSYLTLNLGIFFGGKLSSKSRD
jgi:hypothetical protein